MSHSQPDLLQRDHNARLRRRTANGRYGEWLMVSPPLIVTAAEVDEIADLIGKTLLDPGDTVIIENPAYLGAIQAFDAYEAQYVNVATDDQGIDTNDLLRVLREAKRRPKLLYLVPNFQNPTGITLSGQRRREVVAIAAEYGIPIYEDDPYGRLRYSGDELPSPSRATAST
jgi:2-aminoadipate transaminase